MFECFELNFLHVAPLKEYSEILESPPETVKLD